MQGMCGTGLSTPTYQCAKAMLTLYVAGMYAIPTVTTMAHLANAIRDFS